MDVILLTLNDLQEKKVSRIDHHPSGVSAYCEVQSANFEFSGYDKGSKELRKRYNISPSITKYFTRRNFFFQKFEEGIALDEESWFSVIPEPVSHYLCKRFQSSKVKKIFEPFCGVGGIAIHLADSFEEYVVNDIDKKKVKMLRNNLKVYGKNPESLSVYCEDFLKIEPFQTDALVICPPWGGVDLTEYSTKDLDVIMNPRLTDILNHASRFCENIMLQMPKNTNIENLLKVVLGCRICPIFTIEKIMTNNKVSQLFIYFGTEKFTKIENCQLYSALYTDLGLKEADKKVKREVKETIRQDPYGVLSKVYSKKHPKRTHIFFT